jgi:hypothetical protein
MVDALVASMDGLKVESTERKTGNSVVELMENWTE